jgi:hypothetical protein
MASHRDNTPIDDGEDQTGSTSRKEGRRSRGPSRDDGRMNALPEEIPMTRLNQPQGTINIPRTTIVPRTRQPHMHDLWATAPRAIVTDFIPRLKPRAPSRRRARQTRSSSVPHTRTSYSQGAERPMKARRRLSHPNMYPARANAMRGGPVPSRAAVARDLARTKASLARWR